MIDALLLRLAVILGLLGMVLGIAMGIGQNFTLAPAHAHLNLVGFVLLFLAGLYYRVFPEAAASPLAKIQAAISITGAVVFPIGIGAVLLGAPEHHYEPLAIAGALIVLAGMALFAVVVFRAQRTVAHATAPKRLVAAE